ncbi:alpha-L-rhamnosidase-related protein [Flindersiella endophytica]
MPGDLSIEVVAVQVNTDVTETMELELDSPVLQWIADAFRQTARNGLHGHPDLAGIGKAGWTGANHWMAQPALYQFGMQSIYAKWLEDLRLGQAPDGEVPLIAPMGATSGGFLFTPSSTGVYPYLVHRYCMTYGDRALAARFFDSVGKYIEWSVGKLASGVSEDRFGDWYPPNPPKDYPSGPEGGALVGVAYVIQSLRHGTALAELLGKGSQAAAWRAKAEDLVGQFNARFLDAEAGVYRTERTEAGYRQTSNAVPLAFGFVPAEHRARVLAGLADDIEARGRHLDTGNVGTATLPFALTDHGRSDLAHAVLGQTDYPSYGYLRSLGATTFWESWEADSRGHNDPTLSAPVSWLVERVVGVQATSPGWARFRVAPVAFGSLEWASVSLDTVRGLVSVGWRRAGDVVALRVRVPVNAVADVELPNGKRRRLGSGRHLIAFGLGRSG